MKRVATEEQAASQKAEFSRLLEQLGPASHEQIQMALDAREVGEPEEGLTPELVAWLEEHSRSHQKAS